MTQNTSTTTLTIMRDEISMLEHELHRQKTENAVLMESLQRAEKLVYGQSFSTKENIQSAPNVPSASPQARNPYLGHHAGIVGSKPVAAASGVRPRRPSKLNVVARNTNTQLLRQTVVTKRKKVPVSGPSWGGNLPSR